MANRAKIIILIIVSIIFIGSLSGGSSNQEPTKTDTNLTTATKSVVDKKEKKWVKVAELTGVANNSGDNFTISGEKQRITYRFNGDQMSIGTVYLMKSGNTLDKDGGIPDVYAYDNTLSGTVNVRKQTGDYYINVTAANVTGWNVTVEDYK